MKFLCDRCKTRYSIADERVRGKILKIRCKNCSNVITVREGMPEPEPESPAEAAARRAIRPTDYAPAIVQGSGQTIPPATAAATTGPLQSAFAQAMNAPAAPPSQLEEEWYVSIDGEQEGPFRLPEAQAWVSARSVDDDLYCWCEGFDDWLPVEKVSHFRGLRKPRTPAPRAATSRPVPPPPGKKVSRATPAAGEPAREEEPKPLFAATLAALEADVSGNGAGKGGRADTLADTPRAVGRSGGATGAGLAEVRPTGSGAPPVPALPGARSPAAPPVLARATPIDGTPARPGPSPSSSFDDSDSDADGGDAGRAPAFSLDDLARGGGGSPSPAGDFGSDDGDAAGDDDLAIGEVSRVVRLTDIAAQARRPRPAAGRGAATPAPAAATRATAAIPALVEATAPATPLAEAAASSLQDDHGAPTAEAPGDGPAVLAPVAHPPQRRQSVVLLAVGAALLLAVIGLIVFFASGTGDEDDDGSSGGGAGDVESLARTIDDPRYPRGGAAGTTTPNPDPGAGTTKKPTGGTTKKPGGGSQISTGPGTGAGTGNGSGKTERVMGPDGPLEPLTPDDVITQALKMSTGTQRCYERALKDDPFLKVKSIGALISVNAAGQVTSVSLDQMATTNLGKCLIAAIKRWPFRKSTGGIDTKITLKFEQTVH